MATKPSDKADVRALGIALGMGGAAALALWYFLLPDAHWGVHVAFGILVAAVGFGQEQRTQLLKQQADK